MKFFSRLQRLVEAFLRATFVLLLMNLTSLNVPEEGLSLGENVLALGLVTLFILFWLPLRHRLSLWPALLITVVGLIAAFLLPLPLAWQLLVAFAFVAGIFPPLEMILRPLYAIPIGAYFVFWFNGVSLGQILALISLLAVLLFNSLQVFQKNLGLTLEQSGETPQFSLSKLLAISRQQLLRQLGAVLLFTVLFLVITIWQNPLRYQGFIFEDRPYTEETVNSSSASLDSTPLASETTTSSEVAKETTDPAEKNLWLVFLQENLGIFAKILAAVAAFIILPLLVIWGFFLLLRQLRKKEQTPPAPLLTLNQDIVVKTPPSTNPVLNLDTSYTKRIRRLYKKMVEKQLIPPTTSTPQQQLNFLKMATPLEAELLVLYEKARYQPQGVTREDWQRFKRLYREQVAQNKK